MASSVNVRDQDQNVLQRWNLGVGGVVRFGRTRCAVIASEYGLPRLDASALTADESLWLPAQGHFSPEVTELVGADANTDLLGEESGVEEIDASSPLKSQRESYAPLWCTSRCPPGHGGSTVGAEVDEPSLQAPAVSRTSGWGRCVGVLHHRPSLVSRADASYERGGERRATVHRGLSVIVVAPVLNEEQKIGLVVDRVPRAVADEVPVVDTEDRLSEDWTTLAEALRDAGYATVAFTANGFVSRMGWFLTQGFDDVVELFRGKADMDVARADEVVEPVIGWLHDHRERPFFAYLHFVQPHEPYNAAPAEFYADLPAYSGPYDGSQEQMLHVFYGDLHPGRSDIGHIRGLYEGNLRYADRAVGRILDALRQLCLVEGTIVIVAADHGESLGERGTFGHGNSVDAEQISIPLIVRLPAALGMRGRRGDEVGVIDLMPTLLDILGVPGPPGMAGRNLFDATSDGWPRSLISVAANGAVSVVARGFKYSFERGPWRERLMRLPAQEDGPNVSWEYPVSFAYLASEAQRMVRSAPRAEQPAPQLPAETRKALRALGYVNE